MLAFAGTPLFVSVTCTKNDFGLTLDLCRKVRDAGHVPAAHMLCGGKSRKLIAEQLDRIAGEGITRIVALRGDAPPAGSPPGDSVATDEFVAMIAERGGFEEVCVAGYPGGHPEAASAARDVEFLARKVRAGATRVITQICYDEEILLSFHRSVRDAGLDVKVSAGLLPVRNYERALGFSERCGAPFPQGLRDRFEAADREGRREIAASLLGSMSERMARDGMDLHYYTLNSVSMINESLEFAG